MQWTDGLQAALDRIDAGDPAQAELICRRLLLEDAANHAVLLLLGLAVGAQGHIAQAQPLLQQLAHARANATDPRQEHVSSLIRLHCRELVTALFRACLTRAPNDTALRYCTAEFLHEASSLNEALQVLDEGIQRNPRWPAALQLLGIVLADQGRFGAAIARFRQVTAMVPQQAGGWANLGAMLKVEGRFDAALKAYDQAFALAPDDARIRVNRTVALLRAGRLREAWRDFECRLALPEHRIVDLDGAMPLLPGIDRVTGRTILVTHSDGFGDTIQFMRYLPLLAAHGARVLVRIPPSLRRIMSGMAELVSDENSLPPFDFYCPFVSLPRVFNTSLETIPHHLPYISVDPDLASHWAARLPADGPRVGLVWSGQARSYLPGFDVLDSRRSTTLATLAPLGAVSNARFISLQAGPAAEQVRSPTPGLTLHDPMSEVTDFADTAAIIANLDVVVSVDTSVAHLAGAMDKPVLLLDRYDNCWRWLSGRTDSPWYPSLRIFRQKKLGEWGPVIARVAAALKAYFSHWEKPARSAGRQ